MDSNIFDVGLLQTLIGEFEQSTAGWSTVLHAYGIRLFGILSAIEMTWFALSYMLDSNASIERFFSSLIRRVLQLGFIFYFLVAAGPFWLSEILRSFQAVGEEATNSALSGGLSPTEFLNLGINLAVMVTNGIRPTGVFGLPGSFMYVGGLFAILLLLVAFVVMAGMVTMTIVELWLAIGAAPFLSAFAATRWTYPIAEALLTHIVRASIKVFLMYLYTATILSFLRRGAVLLAHLQSVDLRQVWLWVGVSWIAAMLMFSLQRISGSLIPNHINWGLNPKHD